MSKFSAEMSEPKDPAIKLFGKTIPVAEVSSGAPLPSFGAPAVATCGDNTVIDQERGSTSSNSLPEGNIDGDGEDREVDKDTLKDKPAGTKQEDECLPASSKGLANGDPSSVIAESPKTPSVEKDSNPPTASNTDEQSETCNSQDKTLKKPDKILPCPRCNSMDTKFCYYNNYNVNQPRHFCKNCQRYWTAGGTMRNVPVGAGRRKNKNSTSHHRQMTVSEALQNGRVDRPNGVHHPLLKPNGAVLAFGSDKPLCESMASVLNLADKTMHDGTRNGFHTPEELRIPVSYECGESDDHSNGSSTTSISKDEAGKPGLQGHVIQNCQGFFPPQIPCFPGVPWPYPWNSAQWSSTIPPPAFGPPSFPVPFYPATAYWGCAVPGALNIPWVPQPSSPNQAAQSSSPNSPTLGKHSRDGNLSKSSNSEEEEQRKEDNTERCLWIPKTLRIDDPGEAAKSSIWATLGIKNEKVSTVSEGGLFKSFKSKDDEKNPIAKPSPVLQLNPAALSRSIKFHENS